jgi:uncharacterized protein involved in tolerance to divalent cations
MTAEHVIVIVPFDDSAAAEIAATQAVRNRDAARARIAQCSTITYEPSGNLKPLAQWTVAFETRASTVDRLMRRLGMADARPEVTIDVRDPSPRYKAFVDRAVED